MSDGREFLKAYLSHDHSAAGAIRARLGDDVLARSIAGFSALMLVRRLGTEVPTLEECRRFAVETNAYYRHVDAGVDTEIVMEFVVAYYGDGGPWTLAPQLAVLGMIALNDPEVMGGLDGFLDAAGL
ncbi:hypothetical protein Afil01_50930 [Actinorhabdospora filicis]|uniref:Uncharacterized protein n=1 Tax=Actinorhabdospora filicis TaxID=1785913 RepID=A0A9W6WC64_9ACTN|nr:hypothetical protein [Actinorhabdospora filicis]GLZ80286.1 hypothetical protein Afil01_50930 [Actinorhabdospora filicis]